MIQPRSDFLLALEDSIRSVEDASQIIAIAASRLGWHLRVNRCAYAEVGSDQDTFDLTGDFTDGVASIVGRYRFADFGEECLRLMRAGEPFLVEDSELDSRTASVHESYRQTAIRAVICVPLRKSGRLVAAMAVHQALPRKWQPDEVELLQQVASRCWESIERARVSRELQQLNEILEQRVHERTSELIRSERHFAQLVNGITDCAIYMLDPTGRVTSWNPGAARIKGYRAEEVIGREFSLFYSREDVAAGKPQQALEIARTQGKFEGEGWRVRKDGSTFWASVLIDPIYGPGRLLTGYAKITRDMTDRRRMQEQLNQSQKMEAIGQLTGGVAHDFNNLLTVILGNLDTIYRHASADSPKVKRAAEHAMRGAEKAASLTHQLLAFSRQQSLTPKPTDVNQLVTGLLDLIRRLLPEAIGVELRTRGGVGIANVDQNQLESALLNLAVNAKDAITGRGRLTFSTEAIHLDAMAARQLGELPAGSYIVISVSDTGSGMTSDVMARAFDPFFTTKPLGAGTGLGLSQVFGFVKQSGGHVRLESEVGSGTTVNIYLPRSEGPVARASEQKQELPCGASNETLLIVEDEPDVRSYAIECLEELGFSVLAVSEASVALEMLVDHPEIRLLVTDVGLPGMTGPELVERIRRTRPALPVLFMSGYARDRIFNEGRLAPNSELLTKPFSRTQLAKCVRALLDRTVAA